MHTVTLITQIGLLIAFGRALPTARLTNVETLEIAKRQVPIPVGIYYVPFTDDHNPLLDAAGSTIETIVKCNKGEPDQLCTFEDVECSLTSQETACTADSDKCACKP
ncbi:hypothetical protein LTR56_005081 [Elasticomyces elasticus]|nr:hypothetical protein LTR22_026354 [Elasticomyces elasticus]KAK3652371.1 hypothetical protein LTR56_005081 [Elasticomyces elasticus]KAK5748119.1 hypothetical protein LTS12_021854 [Elasticomyces elasticus]